MGQDYSPHIKPDPNHWVACSCGEFKTTGRDTAELVKLVELHAKINKDTHYSGGGTNSYIIHIPSKPKWYRRLFGSHKGIDN
jgi:hypothetical protein